MTLETAAANANYGTTASGSSFYAAMRILPREQREAMFQIYSFCRQVDDIADSDGPRPERLAALQQWRDDIDALYQGHPPARLQDYVGSVKKFDLKREDFLAIVDGMEMDVPQDIGRALQLTNILRDIDEDAALGRLYLPREGLLEAGITETDPLEVAADPRLPNVCPALVARAREHFEKADDVMARHPRRIARAPRIMSKYYGAILQLLIARGFSAPRAPVRVSKVTRLAIVLRYAFI